MSRPTGEVVEIGYQMRRELELNCGGSPDVGETVMARLVTEMEAENCGMISEVRNRFGNARAVSLGIGRGAAPGRAAVGKDQADAL